MANITLELIQQLREMTGVGMMDCKKALQESNGDIEKAIEILRKKGASIAQKRAQNETAQGIVHAYIHPGAKVGVLVEIDCETDFVARTDDMKKFASDIAMQIAAYKPLYIDTNELDEELIQKEYELHKDKLKDLDKQEARKYIIDKYLYNYCLLKQPFIKNEKLTVDDLLKDLMAKMGENIKIRRFARFEVGL
jgi:elongation factor Ts